MTRGILLAALLAVACKSGGDQMDAATRPDTTSCDALAKHLIAVCDPITGEDFRALCEVGIELITPATRTCISEMHECTEAAVEACHLVNLSFACSEDGRCPSPLMCDPEGLTCVRCMSDGDCGAGRGCLMGKCFDADSDFYLQLRALFDAGVIP